MLVMRLVPSLYRTLTGYGKLSQNNPVAFRMLLGPIVGKSWFASFYLIGMVWNAYLMALLYQYLHGDTSVWIVQPATPWHQLHASEVVLLAACMQVQLGRRAYEDLIVLKNSSEPSLSVVQLLVGNVYYVCTCMAWWIESLPGLRVPSTNLLEELVTLWSLRHTVGLVVFVYGSYKQNEAHRILSSLRTTGERVYKIPYGGWFTYSTCAHYFAEIVLYSGLCVVAGWNVSVVCMMVFVLVNLTSTAHDTHKWYVTKFKETWPSNRWIIIPFVY
jgi:3-oxo-5-alpha-steroid 4-dehydrogenase 3